MKSRLETPRSGPGQAFKQNKSADFELVPLYRRTLRQASQANCQDGVDRITVTTTTALSCSDEWVARKASTSGTIF